MRNLALLVAILVGALGCRSAARDPATVSGASREGERAALAPVVPDHLLLQPLAGDPMAVEVHRLANGLTVYISTDRQKPRFDAWIAVRAGSRHDPSDSTGLAHALEHMLFKGTERLGTLDYAAEKVQLDRIARLYDELRRASGDEERAAILGQIDDATQASVAQAIPNELDRLYKELGIEGVNAFTGEEMTVYIGDVPANRLEAWAAVEGERFGSAVMRLFYPELEAVYEEKNRSLDSPDDRMYEALVEGLFPGHPYAVPTLGTVEHLKVPAFADMLHFFERWYVPNNVAIILAGDIDARTALPVLERAFAGWRPAPLPTLERKPLPPISGRIVRETRAEGEESLMMAWRTVRVTDEDEPALVVLDWLMDNARTGLLNIELGLTQKLPSVGSFPNFYNEAGFWAMNASIRQDQTLAEAEALLLGVRDKLKAGQIKQSDIDAILLHEEIGEKRALEGSRGRVGKMLQAWVSQRTWPALLARDERLRKVRREDVVRVANKYLGDDYVVVLRKKGKPDLPAIEKPRITPIALDNTKRSDFATGILDLKAPELEPVWLVAGRDYTRSTLPAGPMIAAKNTRNDLFSIVYYFERGYREEPLLCYALELRELSGAGELPAEELQRRLFALGTTVGTSCNADDSSVSLAGIDRNLDESVRLLDEWFRSPRNEDDVLARLLNTTLSQRRDELEDADAVSGALRDFARYASESPVLQRPPNRVLIDARREALNTLTRQFPDHAHQTLYFGPLSAADAARSIAWGKEHRPVAPPEPRHFRAADTSRIFFLHKDVAKASVAITLPRKPLESSLRPTAELYSEYLSGGMNSLIFQEIREARGLAYSAFAYYTIGGRPVDPSGLVGAMQTQVDKTPEALSTMLELVNKRALEPSRLSEARTALDQGYRATRIDPRYVVQSVLGWDRRGEPSDPRPGEWRRTLEVDVDDVGAFAASAGSGAVIVSVTADRARLDWKAMEAIAPVTEVTAEELFGFGEFPAP